MSFVFYARGDSSSANNGAINSENTGKSPTTELRFEKADPDGDVELEFNNGASDPDTLLYIDGVARFFTVEFSGTLPDSNKFSDIDGLDLRGEEVVVITDESTDQRHYFLTNPDLNSFSTMESFPNGSIPLDDLNTTEDVAICFARGTHLQTPQGRRKVEELEVGDLVDTANGPKLIVWIGSTRLSHMALYLNENIRPVIIDAHTFGPGAPQTSLVLSPNHRVVLADHQVECLLGTGQALCAVKHLVNGNQIRAFVPQNGVEYFHVLLDTHEVLMAENLGSESLFLGDIAQAIIDPVALSALRSEQSRSLDIGVDSDQQVVLPEMKAHEAAVWLSAGHLRGSLAA